MKWGVSVLRPLPSETPVTLTTTALKSPEMLLLGFSWDSRERKQRLPRKTASLGPLTVNTMEPTRTLGPQPGGHSLRPRGGPGAPSKPATTTAFLLTSMTMGGSL